MESFTMTRMITGHEVNECNQQLTIQTHDDPGAGGANHLYTITGFNAITNPSDAGYPNQCMILFQNGPIGEAGVNGITQEALLAVVRDRLECFQAGPYTCEANRVALAHINNALAALHTRTKERQQRGVEGTHQK